MAVLGTALAGALATLLASDALAERPWLELRTPNFVLFSDIGEKALREAGRDLERAHALGRGLAPWLPRDQRPHRVVVARDEKSRRRFDPKYRPLAQVEGPEHGWTLMFGAEAKGRGPALVTAGRVASLLDQRFGDAMPLWYREGLYDVLAGAVFRADEAEVGHPLEAHLHRLVMSAAAEEMRATGKKSVAVSAFDAIVPPSRLVVVRRRAPGPDVVVDPAARAQSWAFVHFLMFGEGGKRRAAFNRLGTLLVEGTPAHEATATALGDLGALDEAYRDYVRAARFHFERLELSGADGSAWPVRALGPGEIEALADAFKSDVRAECEAVGKPCPGFGR